VFGRIRKRKKVENKKHPLRTELPAHLLRKEEVIGPENIPEGAKEIGGAIQKSWNIYQATCTFVVLYASNTCSNSTMNKAKLSLLSNQLFPSRVSQPCSSRYCFGKAGRLGRLEGIYDVSHAIGFESRQLNNYNYFNFYILKFRQQ